METSGVNDRCSVALIGNPNTGKSSIFNALCGMTARVGNYPGVTVEQKVGRMLDSANRVELVDLPGTYSLAARSADEAVAVNILSGDFVGQAKPDAVVVIVDATNIERNLYLFSQVVELGLPTILVLNMWDRLKAEGIEIDAVELGKRLGIPVVCTSASHRTGIDELRDLIDSNTKMHRSSAQPSLPSSNQDAVKTAMPTSPSFPQVFRDEVQRLSNWLSERKISVPLFTVERMLIDLDGHFEMQISKRGCEGLSPQIKEARARLNEAGCRVPMFETKARYAWIQSLLDGLVQRQPRTNRSWSDRVDRWLTHRWFGMIFFCLVMFLVFQSITIFAEWPMKAIESAQEMISFALERFIAPGAMRSLLIDGVTAGVGSVLTFLPLIAILFFFIAMMEDCGYMARAAFVMDKLMSSIGMNGRSFLPLMSSFACAVPGIMATRTIDNPRDRMVTLLVAPLMSCSARLPVYLLMVSAFVPKEYLGGVVSLQGLVLLVMQSLGAIVAVPVAWLLKKFMFPGEPSTFIMELPSYKWPSWRVLGHRVWERLWSFIARAGTLIFVTSILVWAAGYFPGNHRGLDSSVAALETLKSMRSEWEAKEQNAIGTSELDSILKSLEQNQQEILLQQEAIGRKRSELIQSSYLGMAGHAIEPVVKPLGWDWKVGVAVIASFPAREVIIATLGTIYSLGGDELDSDEGLKEQMQGAKWADGRPIFSLASACSIMVFFALCAQCSATLMTIRRETNSWRWPIFSFMYMTTLAYIGAFITFQFLSLWT